MEKLLQRVRAYCDEAVIASLLLGTCLLGTGVVRADAPHAVEPCVYESSVYESGAYESGAAFKPAPRMRSMRSSTPGCVDRYLSQA